MKAMITIMLALGIVGVTAAYDLGNQAPVRNSQSSSESILNPIRQGGDTTANAFVIPCLPYADAGTTIGYVDDYDEVCPYNNSFAPDVVYRYTPGLAVAASIDLCGSDYDTKLYVYDADMNLIACNDDFYDGPPCGMYVSKLENVPLQAGSTYYIIIDGYGGASGAYVVDFDCCGCGVEPLPCPAGGSPEGEPALVPDYVDSFNGGCNSPPDHPFQDLNGSANGELVFCGVSGWYTFDGSGYRDTDWFRLVMGPAGAIEVAAEAQVPTYILELGPQDCATVGVVQQITAQFGQPSTMVISGYQPGQVVWLWAGPTVFAPSPCQEAEYDYVLRLSGLEPAVATEPTSWSTVKALFK